MRNLSLVVLLNVLLAACSVVPDESSPLYAPPRGSRLILKQNLTIPPGHAGVTLQYGKVVADKDRDNYRPSCRLEVNDVRDTPQIVQPDEFVARRVRHETGVSALGGPTHVADKGNGRPAFLVFRTLFDLESARQPQVRWLDCRQWDDPALGEFPSIRDIRAALGDIMELRLPESGARR